MSTKSAGPVNRLFDGAITLLGATIAIVLSINLLAQVWGWLLLVAALAGVVVGLVLLLRWRAHRAASSW